jgi:hypothetical protein
MQECSTQNEAPPDRVVSKSPIPLKTECVRPARFWRTEDGGLAHRKNALFLPNAETGPRGDLYMILIHACELCGANLFHDLSELQRRVE